MRRLTWGGKGIMVCVDFSTAIECTTPQLMKLRCPKEKRVWSEREYFVVGAWKKRSDLFLYSQGKYFSNLSRSRIIFQLFVASERWIRILMPIWNYIKKEEL